MCGPQDPASLALSDLPQLSQGVQGFQQGAQHLGGTDTISQQVRAGAPPSTGARSVRRLCGGSQGTRKEGPLICDEGRAKSPTSILKVAQRPVWFWEKQQVFWSFPLIEKNYFAPAFYRKGVHKKKFCQYLEFYALQS